MKGVLRGLNDKTTVFSAPIVGFLFVLGLWWAITHKRSHPFCEYLRGLCCVWCHSQFELVRSYRRLFIVTSGSDSSVVDARKCYFYCLGVKWSYRVKQQLCGFRLLLIYSPPDTESWSLLDMALLQTLKSLLDQQVNKRLSAAAAGDIFGMVGRILSEYEERALGSRQENERQRRLLDTLLKPEIRLQRSGW